VKIQLLTITYGADDDIGADVAAVVDDDGDDDDAVVDDDGDADDADVDDDGDDDDADVDDDGEDDVVDDEHTVFAGTVFLTQLSVIAVAASCATTSKSFAVIPKSA